MKTDLVANEERELLTRRHPAFGFTACVLAAVSFLVATPNPSTASTAPSTLCHGYAGCSTGSFTTHGYPSHSGSSYWRMYAGNNCTNYVAYVESTAFGVATPANLLGDADQWPANATLDGALVNHTPTVGSVAEWNPGSPGIPYPGHVAVVERVGPHNRYIVISQQNILDANDYDWVRIYADSSLNQWQQWPSNFIHFPAGEQTTGQGSSPRVVEIVVRVAPNGPQGEKFEFLGRREHIVTAGLTTDFTVMNGSDAYDIAPRGEIRGHHYALHVSVKGPHIQVVRQGGPDGSSIPRIRVMVVGRHKTPDIVTISFRPVKTGTAAASVIATTTTTVPAATPIFPTLGRLPIRQLIETVWPPKNWSTSHVSDLSR